MKNIWNILGVLALIGVAALVVAVAAHADPNPAAPVATAAPAGAYLTGSIGVDTPVIQRPGRLQDQSTEAHLSLVCHNAIGHLAFTGGGDLQLRPGRDYYGENKFTTGVELPLGHGLTPYFTFERRFAIDDNRFLAGLRWDFCSR